MSLRTKTLLIITVVTSTLVLIVYAILAHTLETGSADLEARDVQQDVARVSAALGDTLTSLDNTAGGWAPSDDTYASVEDGNQALVESNLKDSTFSTLRLNVVVFADSSGRIVDAKAFDLEHQVAVPVPADLQDHLHPGDPLLQSAGTASQSNGIVLLSEGPLLVASGPLLTSTYQGPIRGTLIVGRFLDKALAKQLAQVTNLSLTVFPWNDAALSSDQRQARDALSDSAPMFVQPLSEQTVAGFTELKDIYGKPAVLVQVNEPREIYAQGQASLHWLLVALVSVSLILGLLAAWLFERLVVFPLSRLSKDAVRIEAQSGLSERVKVVGMDELADLGGAINRMLGALELSQTTMVRLEEAHQVELREKNKVIEAEQTRRAELSALTGLAKSLAASSDLNAILNLVASETARSIHVTFARVALVDGPDLFFRAAFPGRVLSHELPVGACDRVASLPCCELVLKQNTPEIVRSDDPALTPHERTTLLLDLARALCLVPLHADDHTFGLLMLGEARCEEREPFTADKVRLAHSIADEAARALRRAYLFSELENAYLQSVLALANAVDAKDSYTADHSKRLADHGLAIGRELGMSPRELDDLRYAAILHDIGKISVPDAILLKPTKLNQEEWATMRKHPAAGARILAPLPRLAGSAEIVHHHHERYDGKGYPDGLAGEAIPLGARILAVVDSYSAIMAKRIYKEARSQKEAIGELTRCSGAQFDPRIVKVFLRLLKLESSRPRQDFS